MCDFFSPLFWCLFRPPFMFVLSLLPRSLTILAGENMDASNLYAVITIMSFFVAVPLAAWPWWRALWWWRLSTRQSRPRRGLRRVDRFYGAVRSTFSSVLSSDKGRGEARTRGLSGLERVSMTYICVWVYMRVCARSGGGCFVRFACCDLLLWCGTAP